jgi:hypothetical protein
MNYTEVHDFTTIAYCCTVVVLHTAMVVLQTIADCCTVVVLETAARDYTMFAMCCYTATDAEVVLLYVQPVPYMYLQSFLS